jgi:hypothetical protein
VFDFIRVCVYLKRQPQGIEETRFYGGCIMADVSEIIGEYLTDREASKLTGLAVQTLRNYRQKRKGPAYSKIGSAVRYSRHDLNLYMQKYRIEPSAEV